MKEEFLNLLRSVKREGIDDLIRLLKIQIFLQHLQVQDFMETMLVDL